jgi:hypothetical protein
MSDLAQRPNFEIRRLTLPARWTGFSRCRLYRRDFRWHHSLPGVQEDWRHTTIADSRVFRGWGPKARRGHEEVLEAGLHSGTFVATRLEDETAPTGWLDDGEERP